MYTAPFIIKPYSFPNPSTAQFPPAAVPAIDPQLSASPPANSTSRTRFTAEEIERLVRLAAEREPWAEPRGKITESWKKLLKDLQSEGYFENSTYTTLQNKIKALVAWQKDPNSSEGQNGVCTMKSTSMMVIVGLLERISASKAAVKQKAKEQKELVLKKANENHVAGEAIRRAALTGMCSHRSDNEIVPDSEEERIRASQGLKRRCDKNESVDHEERAGAPRGPKHQHHGRNEHDEKYEAIFQLLERAEECSKRMEMRAEQNQKEAFEQATKALESYNKLSERILHAIINIGGSDNI